MISGALNVNAVNFDSQIIHAKRKISQGIEMCIRDRCGDLFRYFGRNLFLHRNDRILSIFNAGRSKRCIS